MEEETEDKNARLDKVKIRLGLSIQVTVCVSSYPRKKKVKRESEDKKVRKDKVKIVLSLSLLVWLCVLSSPGVDRCG